MVYNIHLLHHYLHILHSKYRSSWLNFSICYILKVLFSHVLFFVVVVLLLLFFVFYWGFLMNNNLYI